MSNISPILGIILGAILVVGYLIAAKASKKGAPELSDGIVLFLCAVGVVAGIRVCYASVWPGVLPETLSAEKTHFFIGGLSVVWVSVQAILKKFRFE